MLTVKSDDVAGRTKMYKNIVDGDLKITNTDENPDEVIHSFRLTFDIVPEIV